MKRLLILLIICMSYPVLGQGPVSPCYWSGSLTRCFPSTGLNLSNGQGLQLGDYVGDTVTFTAASPTAVYAVVMPGSQGGVTTILQNDGSGNLSWVSKPTGTVSSIGFADSGGIFSLSGTPVTTTGTITEAVTGTSGGVVYFNSNSQVSSSAVLVANGVVLGGGAGTAPSTTAAGTANQILTVPGAGGAPAFGSIQLASSAAVTGKLQPVNGGTGVAAVTSGAVVIGAGTSAVTTASGTTNQVMVWNGTSAVFGQVNLASSAAVTGTLPAANIPTTISAATTFSGGINVPTASGAGVNVYSTTFTPSINSGSGGITGDSPGTMYVTRVGNNVICTGTMGITSNSTSEQSFNMQLPYTTTNSAANGSFIGINAGAFVGIIGNASGTQAFVDFMPMNGTLTYHYVFQYQIN